MGKLGPVNFIVQVGTFILIKNETKNLRCTSLHNNRTNGNFVVYMLAF